MPKRNSTTRKRRNKSVSSEAQGKPVESNDVDEQVFELSPKEEWVFKGYGIKLLKIRPDKVKIQFWRQGRCLKTGAVSSKEGGELPKDTQP